MEVRKKVAKNAFYNTADSLAMMAVGYIFWIIVGKLLQPNEFGIISIIVGLYSLIMPITTLGLSGVLVRFISNLSVESKLEQARYITVASLKVVAALSLAAAVFVFFFSSEIANSIYSNPSLSNPLKILSIMLFFGSLSVLLKGALMGLQRFREMFYFDLFAGSLRLIAVLGLVIMGFGYAGAIFGFAIQFFLLTVIVFYYVFKHLPPVSKKYPTKEVMSYGVAAGLSTVASYMLSQGGIILLGFLGTLEAVAFFNIAVFFGLLIQLSSYVFQTTIAPTISELWAMGDRARLEELVRNAVEYMMLIAAPVVAFSALFAEFLINIFFNASYLPASSIIAFYLPGSLLFGLASIMWYLLYYTNEPKTMTKLMVVSAALSVAISIPMIMLYGYMGAAYAFVLSQILAVAITLPKVLSKLEFQLKKLEKPVLAVALLIASSYIIMSVTGDLLSRAAFFVFAMLAYAFLIFKWGVFAKAELELLEMLAEKLKFLKPVYRIVKKLVAQ